MLGGAIIYSYYNFVQGLFTFHCVAHISKILGGPGPPGPPVDPPLLGGHAIHIVVSVCKVREVGVTTTEYVHVCSKLTNFLEVSMHPRAVLQFKSTVRVPRQSTMSVFVLREVRDGRQDEPVVTRERKHFRKIHESNCKLWSFLVCLALVDA